VALLATLTVGSSRIKTLLTLPDCIHVVHLKHFQKRRLMIKSSNLRSAILMAHILRPYSKIQRHFALISWRTDSSESILPILLMRKLAVR